MNIGECTIVRFPPFRDFNFVGVNCRQGGCQMTPMRKLLCFVSANESLTLNNLLHRDNSAQIHLAVLRGADSFVLESASACQGSLPAIYLEGNGRPFHFSYEVTFVT